MEETKEMKCNYCKVYLPIHKFSKNRAEKYLKSCDECREKQKIVRDTNKEKIAQKDRKYYEKNEEKIIQRQKEYYQKNREKLNEKITCPCGSVVNKKGICRHEKTHKHQQWEKNRE